MESSASRRYAYDPDQAAWSFNLTVKCEPAMVNEEPEWGECGVSEAAAAEGLYAGHVVKDELVIGPELLQQQDIAFSIQNNLTSNEKKLRWPKADGFNTPPGCSHTCPGDGPRCNRNTEQQHGLRSCFVRLERLPDFLTQIKMHKELLFCKICSKQFLTQTELTSHVLSHTAENLYYCDVRIHTGEKPYSCVVCNKRLRQSAAWNEHKRIHKDENENAYKCEVCNKPFRDESALIRHFRAHRSVRERPYGCDVCGQRFTERSHMTQHKRWHMGEKPFVCNVCKKSFRHKPNLRRHERVHTGEKPYSCDVCMKPFRQEGTLRDHRLVHTGERPYGCDVCGQRFAQRVNLNQHSKWHTGENQCICDVCNKTFRDKFTLKIHERLHTGEKPYSCDVCNKRFRVKISLTKHKNIHASV